MKKIKLICLSLMSISLLASCSTPSPDPNPSIYKVTCSNGASINNQTATKGEDYTTKIYCDTGIILPDSSDEVTVTINQKKNS